MAFARGHVASENRAGVVKLASIEDVQNGTDNTKAVTPAGVAAAIEANTDIDARLLGVVFDGTNAAGTRTYGAANKTFTRSTDALAGTTALADLSEKADADLSNVSDNIDYVVESFYSQSGYSWYKKYKSGWLEQGGRVQMIDGASTTVSFLKSFATEYYTVVGAQRGNNVTDASKVGGWLISEQTASTIKVVNHSGGTNNWYWHACGKGAV